MIDARKLEELVREPANAFPKFVEQMLDIEGEQTPNLSFIPSIN